MDPHVLAVQEVGDPAALQELADRVGGTWLTADDYRTEMADRFATWNDITRAGPEMRGDAGSAGPTSITVFAAASLRETFTDLARRFQADNPGTSVVLTSPAPRICSRS